MRQRVTAKQENASMCFVCGLHNSAGLAASFYELENNELMGIFTPGQQHQGYPGRLHGGVAATILDETMGRVMTVENKDVWGVTIDLRVRYRKPIPLDQEVHVIARVARKSDRSYQAEGRIYLADGTTAVEGSGQYMILPMERIADVDVRGQFWEVVPSDNDPHEVEVPDF